MNKKITKIVLTGGPCAGKTTGLSWIQNAFTKRGYKVLFITESATELINGGIEPANYPPVVFEESITKMQLFKEAMYKEVAEKSKYEKVLIVCDRGALDAKGFISAELFSEIVAQTGKSEIELRDNYDGVFHLVTAAKGAEKFYTLENNTARTETPEQARLADDRIIEAWTGHPHLRIIGNEGDFESKINHLISEIATLLGEPKPYEANRKYLIKYPDLAILENTKGISKVEEYQTYLKCTDDEKIQIRKRGLDDDYIYYQVRSRNQDGQLLNVEKRLTKQEYLEKLQNADPTRKTIKRTRYCLTKDNQYYEIDLYPFWDKQAVINVDLFDASENVNLPEFVEVIEDITNKKEYLNSELAKL